jgi:hypothetical protein
MTALWLSFQVDRVCWHFSCTTLCYGHVGTVREGTRLATYCCFWGEFIDGIVSLNVLSLFPLALQIHHRCELSCAVVDFICCTLEHAIIN